jgi:mRNA interferase MazF
VKQGEVWLVDFSPTVGHEQEGVRPALIVSRKAVNDNGMCMVVPGTTKYRPWPGRVTLPKGEAGLTAETYLICDQLRTVDSIRMSRRLGTVKPKYVRQVWTHLSDFLAPET